MKNPNAYVFTFREIDRTMGSVAGGKGANLGELCRIKDIHVPEGFCISTAAFKRIVDGIPSIGAMIAQLAQLPANRRDQISRLCTDIRHAIEAASIPGDLCEEIGGRLLENEAYAVRSSATAEDLPTASFAGQQDTYLNITGRDAVFRHISKCWASLFTDRAVIYRMQHGFDHRKVQLSVVIQKMIFPQAAGILFTADPVTSNRKIVSVDASVGLGEALVSGLVNPDIYKVRNGEIVDKKISTKKIAFYASEKGGTKELEVEAARQNTQALTDDQILELAQTGRTIEEHFGYPQDIEWCLANDTFYIVQSRPVTTLFPPPIANDADDHVYVSVGHQQMMTDAMKPLGLSFFLLTTRALMRTAGGRLFVDVTPMLASAAGRDTLINVLGKSDPIIKDALTTILERENFIRPAPDDIKNDSSAPLRSYQTLNDYDPAVVSDLISTSQTAIEALRQNIQTRSGPDLFDFILEDIQQLKKIMANPHSFGVIMTGMNASAWINEKMNEWLGEKNAADVLSQSVPNNITSEMGLALLDVADVIRPYPEVIAYLQRVKGNPTELFSDGAFEADSFFNELVKLPGGKETGKVISDFLSKYGMRCSGEIDITRTRWIENPVTLVPLILSNIKNFEPGAGTRKFEQGQREALKKERELLDRLKLIDPHREKEAKQMIDRIRNFAGYREYPKYGMISRYLVYKQALLKEAEKLVQAGIIHEKEDIYYLSFEELHEAVKTNTLRYAVISKRKEDFKLFEKLTPPRVITSDGEVVRGKYNREALPAGAIAGLAVSSGITEGRARVITNMEDANLEEGDILVTTFTDPSWTPLFLAIKGLVTEVGGLMTHGAVIAREYGLPAVVGVEKATKLIRNGQRIRVNGTDGYIELL